MRPLTVPSSGRPTRRRRPGLAVLVELAKHPDGVRLDEIARILRSSKPPIQRALTQCERWVWPTSSAKAPKGLPPIISHVRGPNRSVSGGARPAAARTRRASGVV